MSKNIECEVIRSGFTIKGDELPIGSRIKLTERAVKAFVGKVERVKELEAAEAAKIVSLKSIGDMKDNLKSAVEAIDKLETVNEDLTEKLSDAAGQISSLTAKLGAAETEVKKLAAAAKK